MENNTYREFNMNVVDANYVETYGMEIVAGRNFVKNNTADEQQGVLVNETLVKAFGLDDPVGSSLPAPFQQYQIIGVVKDFNYRSLHSSIEPTLMVSNPAFIFKNAENVDFHGDPNPRISIKIITNDMVHTLAEIKDIWKRAAPGQQFAFTFVNQALDAQYRQEQRLGKILGVTTILGIWIACLGLFGLSTLAVARRTKEIGIRKVLGASVNNIVLLIYKEFIWLLALALVIAIPVAYIAMQRWLSDFAYRITIGTDTFLLTGLLIIVVSGGTIGYQSVKAAMLDPVKSLRDE
jgi:putative ABC transport system permease protein